MSGKPVVTASEIKQALAVKHRGGRDFFLTEVKSGSTWDGRGLRILDAVAIRKSWTQPHITGYEVKTSRSDFVGDAKFYTYLPLVHALYIVTPQGLIQREETPLEIGLIWYSLDKKTLTTKKKPPPRKIEVSAEMLQYIIYSRLEPDRLPFYSSQAEYYRDWLENKRDNRSLGYAVKSKMISEITRLEEELKRSKRFGRGGCERETYDALINVMKDNGLPDWSDPVEWLTDQLKREYPKVLDDIEQQIGVITRAIDRAKMETRKPSEPNSMTVPHE